MSFTLDDAREIARRAHAGQVDKGGAPYIDHVEAVANGLADFDLEVQIAGMLHDVVEDNPAFTIDGLRSDGVPERSLEAIAFVSKNLHPHLSYAVSIEQICRSADARLVKISDNAHNSLPERIARLDAPADPKYVDARHLLYAATPREDVERILRRANPALLEAMP